MKERKSDIFHKNVWTIISFFISEGLDDGGGRPKREPRADDWACASCGFACNFSRNTECFKCKEPRPSGTYKF